MNDSNQSLPGLTPDLLKHLDATVEQPVIRGPGDLDPFEAGRRVGKRELVESLIAQYERDLREQQEQADV